MAADNKRNWYTQHTRELYRDPEIRRMKTKLDNGKPSCIELLDKLLFYAMDGCMDKEDAKNGAKLFFYHDETTFAEEIAFAIEEDIEYVQPFIDYLFERGSLEEVDTDTYILHFPNGMVGSITDSSIRSEKSRAKKRLLQCNNDATSLQHQCSEYNSNSKSNNKIKSDINIDSNSNINIDSNTFDFNNIMSDPAAAAAGGALCATALEGGATPAQRHQLFTFAEVQESAERRKKEKLTGPEIAKMYDDFVSNDFKRCRAFMDKGEEKTSALFHAVNTWAKEYHKEPETETPKLGEDWELEDLKRLTDAELKKMFPGAVYTDEHGEKCFDKGTIKDVFSCFLEDFSDSEDEVESQAAEYLNCIRKKVYKYLSPKTIKDHENDVDGNFVDDLIRTVYPNDAEYNDNHYIENVIPYFVPAKEFTTEERRLMFTLWDIRFPVGKVKLEKDPNLK